MAIIDEIKTVFTIDASGWNISGVEGSLKSLDANFQSIGKSLKRFGEELSEAGTKLTVGLSAPLAALGGVSIKMGADFELGLRQVTSLLGQTSAEADKTFGQMSAGVLELSKRLGVDAVGATKALYEAVSAGISQDNALTFLDTASKAAIAGVTNTKVAVDGLTTVINAYQLSADQASEVSDAMFQAVNIGKVTFEQLSASIGQAAPLAAQLGVDFKELLASMASITKQGVSGGEAFTQISSALRAMIDPSDKMKELFDKLGVASGKALIEAKGFQGALLAIREAANNNETALSNAFGRIEGFRAALSLTGKNATVAAADLGTLRTSVGATDIALREINKSATRQFEMLAASIKATAIEFGNSLAPAVASVLQGLRGLGGVVAQLLQGFKELNPATRDAVIAFGAVLAAAGPVTFTIGKLIAGLPALGAAFAALASPIGLAVIAVTALGAAWVLTFQKQVEVEEKMGHFAEAVRLNAEIEALTVGLEGIRDELRMGAAESWPDYIKRLQEFKSELQPMAALVQEFKLGISKEGKPIAMLDTRETRAAFVDAGAALKTYGELTTDLKMRTAGAEAAMAEWLQRIKEHPPAWANISKAAGLVFVEVKKGVEQTSADIEKAALAAGAATARLLAQSFGPSKGDWMLAMTGQLHTLTGATQTFADAYEAMVRRVQQAELSAAFDPFRRLPQQLTLAAQQVAVLAGQWEPLIAAMKRTGTETQKELIDKMNVAAMDFENMRKSGEFTYDALKVAQVKYLEATRAAIGLTAEQETALKRLHAELGKGDAKISETAKAWKNFVQEVSTIWTDFSRDLATAFFEIFKDPNKDLAKQVNDLKRSMADRAQAWADYQAEASKKMQDVTARHAKELAEEEADLSRSMQDRAREYDKQAASIVAGLDKQRAEYGRFVNDANRKLAGLGTQYASQLADELGKLRANLQERADAYQQFVQQSNRTLQRIGEDLGESLSDQAEDANRSIEDLNRDHARTTADLQKQLRDAQKAGDQERVRDVQEQLRRSEEDYRVSVQRIQQNLAEQTEDARKQASRQTQDLQTELRIRAAEFAAFQADNRAQIEETTRKNQEAEAAARADLEAGIAERRRQMTEFEAEAAAKLAEARADYDQFVADSMAKLSELRARHAEELASELADVQASLDKQRLEYERFVADSKIRLAELEDDFKSTWDRIADAGKSAFESLGKAIFRIIIEGALEPVKKYIGGLMADVLGLTKLITGSASSAATGAAGSAAGAAGGMSGGLGSMGGSVGGLLGPITDIIGAITDVWDLTIQRRIEQDIGRIEVTTRGQLNEALNLRADLWDQHGKLLSKLDDVARWIMDKLDGVMQTIGRLGTVAAGAAGGATTGGTPGIPAPFPGGAGQGPLGGTIAQEFNEAMQAATESVHNLAQAVGSAAGPGGTWELFNPQAWGGGPGAVGPDGQPIQQWRRVEPTTPLAAGQPMGFAPQEAWADLVRRFPELTMPGQAYFEAWRRNAEEMGVAFEAATVEGQYFQASVADMAVAIQGATEAAQDFTSVLRGGIVIPSAPGQPGNLANDVIMNRSGGIGIGQQQIVIQFHGGVFADDASKDRLALDMAERINRARELRRIP